MSGRLLKKVLKEHEESKLQNHHDEEIEEDDEDGEDENLGDSRGGRSSINPFDLLNEGDDEDEAPDSDKEIEVDDETIAEKKKEDSQNAQPPSKNKSKKKKKKKNSNKNNGSNAAKPEINLDETLEALSLNANKQEKVQETKAETESSSKKVASRPVLEIDPKYLNLENELKRMYGSKVVRSVESSNSQGGHGGGGGGRRGGRRGGVHHITKTVLISPMENWSRWDRSFSMEFLETKEGYNYFRYVHSPSYDQAQRAFQAAQAIHDLNGVATVLIHHPYHIDSLITMADYFKFTGEHQMAADAIGKCLYGLERAWHPMFTPFQGNSRLKFHDHETNKPFFTSLFTHMRNMDRRGCHRSALEVCKLLLSLDNDDPVGALFCVDYFALRAEEYTWLEQFSEEYKTDNSLWLFPNFSYSLAIARVYLEKTESCVDTSKSSSLELMKQALMLHPTVLKKLVDKVPLKDQIWTKILKHSYFRSDESKIPSLDHLIKLYVERNYLIWRLPDVQKLLRSAADLVIESLDRNEVDAKDWVCVRKEAFPSENNQYSHLSVHDFSDSMPTLPPDNLQNFVVDPRMGGGGGGVAVVGGGGGGGVHHQHAPPPRDVANRNPLAVLFESMLPWANYGNGGNDDEEDDDEIAHHH